MSAYSAAVVADARRENNFSSTIEGREDHEIPLMGRGDWNDALDKFAGVEKISVDGVPIDVGTGVALLDDGKQQRVEVLMGPHGTRRAGAFSTAV